MRGTRLIETMRARGGRIPLLSRHLVRVVESARALGLGDPGVDVAALERASRDAGDGVVRIEVGGEAMDLTTRAVTEGSPVVVVAREPHAPYPHKTTERGVFDRALAEARSAGADDALLLTADGAVAEGTAWSLFWWERDALCTPAVSFGILPGIGRARVMELERVREAAVEVAALQGRSLFLVNAVRGVVPLAMLQGRAVAEDARTAELSRAFWLD